MIFCSSLPYFVPRPKNSDEGLEFSLSFIFKNYCCVCPQFIGFEKQYNHANIYYVVSLRVSDWTLPKGWMTVFRRVLLDRSPVATSFRDPILDRIGHSDPAVYIQFLGGWATHLFQTCFKLDHFPRKNRGENQKKTWNLKSHLDFKVEFRVPWVWK